MKSLQIRLNNAKITVEIIYMKENKTLEFKSDITNNFLKTVSAFANFIGGKIIFGIDDNGKACGLKGDLNQIKLDLENTINDSIKPKPDYSLHIDYSNRTILLNVSEGQYKPYLYRGKAYRRSDTSTVEVDQLELKRLVLEGSNLSFEDLSCKEDNLTFSFLENKFRTILGISGINNDTLKTLGFFNRDGVINIAGCLFADTNSFPGIDMVRFGDTINVILDREIYEKRSILEQYDKAVELYKKYYQYEVIDGILRNQVNLVPENAFREAVANALVHRQWDVNAHIQIAMFKDKIVITSPGGLPTNVSKEEYLNGNVSFLRNPIIGNIFFRLHYIEKFGTGIKRIKESYAGNFIQPEFEVSDNFIKIVLPILRKKYETTREEKRVIDLLSNGAYLSSIEISKALKCSKDKAIRLLNSLVEKKYVVAIGNGRGTKYSLSA